MRTNADKVDEFRHLVEKFQALTGLTPEDGNETILGDILAHARHWCDAEQVDFDRALRLGRYHHENEVCQICGETAEDNSICSLCWEERQ